MSAWGKSDNTSSGGTVTLTAPAITFNAATGHAAGVYTSAGHPFQLGDPVAYANGGGTSVVGLTSGSTYYVTNVTANTFALAATEAKALHNDPTIIASTDGVGAVAFVILTRSSFTICESDNLSSLASANRGFNLTGEKPSIVIVCKSQPLPLTYKISSNSPNKFFSKILTDVFPPP